jgi:hypothetical protein
MDDERDLERSSKREIMGTKKKNLSALTYSPWDEGIGHTYHEVEMTHLDELESGRLLERRVSPRLLI